MVGGEVEESIFHGYMNKFHDGFIGHAYVCEWCNIGALGTNSAIKNNYSIVKMHFRGKLHSTGMTKVGCMMGDHSKIGIGALLNTGTVIGACSNIFTSVAPMPGKHVPSFAWGSGAAMVEYKLDKSLETAKEVYSRRNHVSTGKPCEFTDADAELMKKVYELTKADREAGGIK